MDEQTCQRGAALAAIARPAQVHVGRDRSDIHTLEDDVRRLATELERNALQPGGGLLHDSRTDPVGAGEGHTVHAGVTGQVLAHLRPADHEVQDAWRQLRLAGEVAQPQRGQRCARRRQHYRRAASGQRRPPLEDAQVERIVVAGDCRHHPDGPIGDLTQRRHRVRPGSERFGSIPFGGVGLPAKVRESQADLQDLGECDRRTDLVDN